MSDRKCTSCGIREEDARTAGRGKCLKITSAGAMFEDHSWKAFKAEPRTQQVNPSDYGFSSWYSPKSGGKDLGKTSTPSFIREDLPVPSAPPMYGRSTPAPSIPSTPSAPMYRRLSHQDIIRECAPIIQKMRREPRTYAGGNSMKPADLVRVGYRVLVGTSF